MRFFVQLGPDKPPNKKLWPLRDLDEVPEGISHYSAMVTAEDHSSAAQTFLRERPHLARYTKHVSICWVSSAPELRTGKGKFIHVEAYTEFRDVTPPEAK